MLFVVDAQGFELKELLRMPVARGSIIKQGTSPNLTIIAPYQDPEGRNRQRWQTVKRRAGETDAQLRKRAEGELQALIVKLRKGEPVAKGRLTLSDFVTQEWLPAVRLNVAERTARGYETIMNRHVLPVIGSKQLQAISTTDIERVYRKMAESGLKGNSRLHAHRVISMACTEAVRRGKLVSNPASREHMKAPRKETFTVQPPTPEEVSRLIAAASGTRIEVLVKVLAYTGLRVGEALGLRWQDVDFKAGMLHVRQTRKQKNGSNFGLPKTERSRRVVHLAPELLNTLREHRDRQFAFNLENGFVPSHDLVFTHVSKQGVVGLDHDRVSNTWKEVRLKAAVPRARIHDLRHFAATTMLAAGVPLPEVSAMLGHGQTSTTANVYAHVVPGSGRAAAAVIEKALTGK